MPSGARAREDVPTYLVTGGAGFIGSTFVRWLVGEGRAKVVTLDKLTYAGNLANLRAVEGHPAHVFVEGDIVDRALVDRLLVEHAPTTVFHFAAESHVDRSIDGPLEFVRTNVLGTCTLLEATRAHLSSLPPEARAAFRYVQVSTDEVFGSLGDSGAFRPDSPFAPNSPYSASKAAADCFVRSYVHTFGLPAVVTHCSNNYGPYQYPEKLIPLMIRNCVEGKPLPVYGDGSNVRDWLHAEDHCRGILAAAERGRVGERYLFGGKTELTNLAIVHRLCDAVDGVLGRAAGTSRKLVTFVADRPGHDHRYAIDTSEAEAALGWTPEVPFERGLDETVRWYLANGAWCEEVSAHYRGARLGLGGKS